jgi:hypothetical protein
MHLFEAHSAIRELIVAAESAGWDVTENKDVLQNARDAFAALPGKALSILDIALAEGAKADERGGISMAEFDQRGLPFFAGCQDCGASLAPYNAYPSKTGFIKCRDCIGGSDLGFATVEEFRASGTDDDDEPGGKCTMPGGHSWVYSGTAYGGDDASYHGEGRCYCEHCGADGDA